MIVTHKINMDLVRRGGVPIIDAVQDDKYVRNLEIALYSGEDAWTPPDGTVVTVRYSKPDGHGGEYDTLPDGSAACSISGNVVTVAMAPQMLTAAGTVRMDLGLICGAAEISTFHVIINVHANVSAQIADSDDYRYVTGYLPMPTGAAVGQYICVTAVDDNGAVLATGTADLESRIADLEFVPIEITAISNSVGTVELGSTVDSVTVNWDLNKAPERQTLNGEEVDTDTRSVTLTGLELREDQMFTVEAVDERTAADSGTTVVYFCNGVYFGVLDGGADLDSAAILSLTRKLQSGKSLSFTVDAGTMQQIAYALPTQYGTPNFNVGGFDGGFYKAATLDFTNASGYTESYDVWLSDNTGLGGTTVKVS